MNRTLIHSALLVSGLALLLIGLNQIAGQSPISSQALAQDLPPRPTIPPTATSARSTATSMPSTSTPIKKKRKHKKHKATPVPTGRITGTVIDLTTGAPAPGIKVTVGEVIVISDANGNYDRSGLPDGNYDVALALTVEQGDPAQEPISVKLADGATVVQHLAFRHHISATPTPVETPIGATPSNDLTPSSCAAEPTCAGG